ILCFRIRSSVKCSTILTLDCSPFSLTLSSLPSYHPATLPFGSRRGEECGQLQLSAKSRGLGVFTSRLPSFAVDFPFMVQCRSLGATCRHGSYRVCASQFLGGELCIGSGLSSCKHLPSF